VSAWPEARSFGDVWAGTVAANPRRLLLRFEGPSGAVHEWRYAEFDHLVARMAAQLVDNGVSPGCAVHLALSNSPVSFVGELPRTSMGKIRKFLLKDPNAETHSSRATTSREVQPDD
jgi:acyl-coenzyme A synthetase/AMP-(fatty) acid ligase